MVLSFSLTWSTLAHFLDSLSLHEPHTRVPACFTSLASVFFSSAAVAVNDALLTTQAPAAIAAAQIIARNIESSSVTRNSPAPRAAPCGRRPHRRQGQPLARPTPPPTPPLHGEGRKILLPLPS